MIQRAVLALIAAGAFGGAASAQEPPPRSAAPVILQSRFDEDWRAMCNPSMRVDPLDSAKCIQLGDGGPMLSFGGELRERFEWVRNPAFGFGGVGEDSVSLHRLLLQVDIRWDQARVFVQVGNHLATRRDFGRQQTDVDRMDLQQGFLDLSADLGVHECGTLRLGRQEISFGSGRLVSAREGPNVRRSFDGARGFIVADDYRVDAFAVRPVRLETGNFDDSSDRSTAFWGVYASGLKVAGPDRRLDLYYLGYRRDKGAFAQGVATELRHSLGARLFGKKSGFDWDLEAVYQFGKFGDADIRAWTIATDTGYAIERAAWRPRIGLKADVASGDRNPKDGRLNTFNALFPRLPYFTEADLVAPANIIDLQPNVSFRPHPAVEVDVGWDVLWRQSRADAFYAAPMTPMAGTAGGGRFLGHQASFGVTWQATPRLSFNTTFVRFRASDSLARAGGRDGDFLMVSGAYKF